MTDRSSRPANSPRRCTRRAGATDRQAALLPALGTSPDQLPPRRPTIDRRPRPGALPDAAAGPYRPGHRAAGPQTQAVPLRGRSPGRAGPRRHQEARPDPRRRRLARLRADSEQHRRAHAKTEQAGHRGAPASRGYVFLHHAVDDHSRLAYSEQLARRAQGDRCSLLGTSPAFFADAGIAVKAVMTDNGSCYRSHDFAQALGPGVKHRRTRPYRPQTNGKVERFNRTLVAEWAYAEVYLSDDSPRSDLRRLAPLLQSPPTPHRHRRPRPSRPRSQPHGELQQSSSRLARLYVVSDTKASVRSRSCRQTYSANGQGVVES